MAAWKLVWWSKMTGNEKPSFGVADADALLLLEHCLDEPQQYLR